MDYRSYANTYMSLPTFKTLLTKLVPEATIADYFAVPSVYRITIGGVQYDVPHYSTEKELREHLILIIPEYFL